MTLAQHPGAPRPSPEALSAGGPRAELGADLSDIARSLHDKYDPRLGSGFVDTEIQVVADRFTNAKIRAFVPLFVYRYAGAKLRDDLTRQAQRCELSTGQAGAVAGPATVDHGGSAA